METKELSTNVDAEYEETVSIKNMIYLVRNQQVMMDSDLAMLYQVETRVLNQAVTRNISRFPERFRFQLTKEEYENLKSQFATSSSDRFENLGCQFGTSSSDRFENLKSQFVISSLGNTDSAHGGRRKLPYAFTEQGIAMLSSVLRSDIAVSVSIRIMDSFVEMRKYMASASLLHERLNTMEVRQINYQKETDERFDKVFDYIAAHEDSEQRVFFDGQIYDAFSLIAGLIEKADSTLVLIDSYVDHHTLDLLSKKKKNVAVTVYTLNNNMLTNADMNSFNAQYPTLNIRYTKKFHDRFLIVDNAYGYHIGASIKDAGKKCFGINLIEDIDVIQDILLRLAE